MVHSKDVLLHVREILIYFREQCNYMNSDIEKRFLDIEMRLSELENRTREKVTNFQRFRLDRLLLLLKENENFMSYIEIGRIFGITSPRVTSLVNSFLEEHPEYKTIKNPEKKRGKVIVKSDFECYTKNRKTNSGIVYILGSTKSNRLYKIGRTLDVSKRVASLNCGSPDPLHLVHSILTNDPVNSEYILHKKFDKKRTKGEWFSLSEEDLDFLKSLSFLSADALRLI